MTTLTEAIAAAERRRRRQIQSGWGVYSSYDKEGLLTIWPTEGEATAEAERLNEISRKHRFRVRYHVGWIKP